MSANALDNIFSEQSAEAPELPRLPVADTFIQFNRMGTHLDNARESFKKIPESTGRANTDAYLKEIVTFCEAAIKIAQRLREANK